MKRVRLAPGKFVTISAAVAEKAERVFASGALNRAQVQEMAALEPAGAGGVLLGRRRTTRKPNKRS